VAASPILALNFNKSSSCTFFVDLVKAKETFTIILAEVKIVYRDLAHLYEKVEVEKIHPG